MTIAAPVFTYPGSKSNLASWIIGQMPKHTRYVEPFAGTLAVLLAKRRVPEEVVNDLDDNLVNFFRVLRDHPDELIRRCELTPYARSEWEYARDIVVNLPGLESDDIERARLWWLHQCASMNGIPPGGFNGRMARLHPFLDRMRGVSVRLQSVIIESQSAMDLMVSMDGSEVLFYCDPPYAEETRCDTVIYRRDMADSSLHRDFAAICQALKGRVIVSGYPSVLYDDELFTVARGWSRLERQVVTTLGAASNNDGEVRTEVLWANFPMRSQLDLFTP